jgi:hypothetical protein
MKMTAERSRIKSSSSLQKYSIDSSFNHILTCSKPFYVILDSMQVQNMEKEN